MEGDVTLWERRGGRGEARGASGGEMDAIAVVVYGYRIM